MLSALCLVIFLDFDLEEAKKRGGYGTEKYETQEIQVQVQEKFDKLQSIDKKEGCVP